MSAPDLLGAESAGRKLAQEWKDHFGPVSWCV